MTPTNRLATSLRRPGLKVRVALLLAAALAACALQRRGDTSSHVRITLPSPTPGDGGTVTPDGGMPVPSLARLAVSVSGADFPPRSVVVAPGAMSFDLDVPAGPARTLAVLGDEARGADLVAAWYGAVTLDLAPGTSVDVTILVVPAGTVTGALYVGGEPVHAQVDVRLEADAPRPDVPAGVVVKTDAQGRFNAVLPTGAYAIALATPDAVPGLLFTGAATRASVVQGETIDVPVELLPTDTANEVVSLLLELVGGSLTGLPSALPADLIVRALDQSGAPAALTGTVTFGDSDTTLLTVPADFVFAGQTEQRLSGAVRALVAIGSATLRAKVRERPEVQGALTVNILPVGTLPGPAVSLRLGLPVQNLVTGLLAKSVDLQVAALDANGLVAAGYRGTVTFADSDTLSLLVPPDYTFTDADAGRHTYLGAVRAIGLPGTTVSLRAHDRDDPSIQGEVSVKLVAQ